jgi:ketosteroid isomerase-like protein
MNYLPKSVAESFVRAINRHDVEALAALMAPEHRFIDSLGNAVVGREKMRSGWTGYFRMVPDYSIAIEESFTEGQVVVLLGLAEGTYAPDGKLKPGARWMAAVALRAQVEDGLISEWRVYADNEPLRERMRKST